MKYLIEYKSLKFLFRLYQSFMELIFLFILTVTYDENAVVEIMFRLIICAWKDELLKGGFLPSIFVWQHALDAVQTWGRGRRNSQEKINSFNRGRGKTCLALGVEKQNVSDSEMSASTGRRGYRMWFRTRP